MTGAKVVGAVMVATPVVGSVGGDPVRGRGRQQERLRLRGRRLPERCPDLLRMVRALPAPAVRRQQSDDCAG